MKLENTLVPSSAATNRLFVPRPIPDYIKPQDRDPEMRIGQKYGAVASFMDALKTATLEENPNEELSPKNC